FSAQETLRLWVGNAGGIRVFWDDKPLKPLGQRGEVVRVKLPNPRFMPEP
ncbi:MAG: helix-turn-helix protein, partial [Desulfacinum sp.]|nr:helix-turn-helix protein [Desulfacinum sp.]